MSTTQETPVQKGLLTMTNCSWITVPKQRLICIEHPAVIKNIANSLATVGGEKALLKLAMTNGQSGIDLRLRGSDYMQPPIQSHTVTANSILVKITIPRRRKKKSKAPKGSGGTETPLEIDLSLLEKLRASRKYTVEVVGNIERTVRFRGMADYQWNTKKSPCVNKIKTLLENCRYEDILNFKLNPKKLNYLSPDILPPAIFSRAVLPMIYNYHQNPALVKTVVDGKTIIFNPQAAPRTLTPILYLFTSPVPTKPLNIKPYKNLQKAERLCVDILRKLFAERPIWSRRALFNHMPENLRSLVRWTMVHVGYMWRSGPWRDTCVSYGIDPRLDPSFRKYQTVIFMTSIWKHGRSDLDENESHIFDGKGACRDGRSFQLCDVTDPLVLRVIGTQKIRKFCDEKYGWYHLSTIRKIRAIMRRKITAILHGTEMTDINYIDILEQETGDEEDEAAQKEYWQLKARKRSVKRWKDKETGKAGTDGKMEVVREVADNEGKERVGEDGDERDRGDDEGEDGENYDAGGDWEEELDSQPSYLSATLENGKADLRVEVLKKEFLEQGQDHLGYQNKEGRMWMLRK